jgi:Tfp pilus assembly protein PilN
MHLNFARLPFRNERLPRLVYGLLGLLVVVATAVHAVNLTRHLLKEREELDVKVGKLEEEISALDRELSQARSQVAPAPGPLDDLRVSFLAGVLRQRGFSWTGLFNELEAITPENVRLKAIVPKEEQGEITVRLSVIGRSVEDILQMVRRLEESHLFSSVMPLDEAEEDPRLGTGVAATLTLKYERGPEPEKPAAAAPAGGL